jgi:hypothetical protein
MLTVKLEGYAEIRASLNPAIVDKAARQALNRAVDSGRAEAARQIYAKWNIKKADINRAVKAIKANTNGDLQATIYAKGRPLSLSYFGAQWFRPRSVTTRHKSTLRKRNTGKSGVFVKLLRDGKTTHKPHAFIAAVNTKRSDIFHIGVFERIPGSRMKSNPDKEALIERKLISIASMFAQANAWDPTIEKVEETWNREFPRLIGVLFAK